MKERNAKSDPRATARTSQTNGPAGGEQTARNANEPWDGSERRRLPRRMLGE